MIIEYLKNVLVSLKAPCEHRCVKLRAVCRISVAPSIHITYALSGIHCISYLPIVLTRSPSRGKIYDQHFIRPALHSTNRISYTIS